MFAVVETVDLLIEVAKQMERFDGYVGAVMSENSAHGTVPLCGSTVVVTEKSTDALPAPGGTAGTLVWRRIAQPLVVRSQW
jgi:hypothetical protein